MFVVVKHSWFEALVKNIIDVVAKSVIEVELKSMFPSIDLSHDPVKLL